MTDTTPTKATPEHWAQCKEFSTTPYGATYACLLELRARVESLEAAERQASTVHQISKPLKLTPEQAQQVRDLLAPNSKPTPNPNQIRSSLVERLAKAIYGPSNTQEGWRSEARAAIREVAAWMISNPDIYFPPALVFALEQEAER
jgi:hypothetical protein